MHIKSRLRRLDVPLQAPVANGFAILSQPVLSVSRHLCGCYVPREHRA